MPGEPPQLTGDLQNTLTDVTGAPGQEVALLEQVVSGDVDATRPGPGGTGQVVIRVQVDGKGTTEWDVKGALVKGSKMTTTMTGTFTFPGGSMALDGTSVVSLVRLP
jgi:hypothetical protein